jgi:hypothetical protein
MAELVCPKCGYHIRLVDEIAAHIRAEWERETITRLRREATMKAKKAADAAYEKELLDRDELIKARDQQLVRVRKQLRAATKGASQDSAQELGVIRQQTLHDVLSRRFEADEFTPIGRGMRGGDVVQLVRDPSGRDCGAILWESKRGYTNWDNKWVTKLKADKQLHGCVVGVIVSDVLPTGASVFCEVEGGVACEIGVTPYVAALLRQRVIEVAKVESTIRRRNGGAKNKVYDYVSGPFIETVRDILQTAIKMRAALEKERRAKATEWKQRDLQLERIVLDLASMYGELRQRGAAFPLLEELEIARVEQPQLPE